MNQGQNTNSKVSKKSSGINGIETFKKDLEKYFFAELKLQVNVSKEDSKILLNIGLNCNFGLTESLFHLNSGNWGGFCKDSTQLENSGFVLSVMELQEQNSQEIVIEEFAIYFKDTSLFITKIPNQDITDQLCDIMGTLSENFVHFTKGLTEMPYEIFVPVFEEPTDSLPDNASWAMEKIRTSYFSFWGLYFHSDINHDSSVYDLKSKNIIDGDFFLLNKE